MHPRPNHFHEARKLLGCYMFCKAIGIWHWVQPRLHWVTALCGFRSPPRTGKRGDMLIFTWCGYKLPDFLEPFDFARHFKGLPYYAYIDPVSQPPLVFFLGSPSWRSHESCLGLKLSNIDLLSPSLLTHSQIPTIQQRHRGGWQSRVVRPARMPRVDFGGGSRSEQSGWCFLVQRLGRVETVYR